MSSAARLRYPACLSGERLRKRPIEVQQALPRTAVLASQRLESNRQSYTVVRESTKPNRRASIPSSSRWEIPSKYTIYRILRGFEAIFQKGNLSKPRFRSVLSRAPRRKGALWT